MEEERRFSNEENDPITSKELNESYEMKISYREIKNKGDSNVNVFTITPKKLNFVLPLS